jgi:sulfonate transport system substrate-binding protein
MGRNDFSDPVPGAVHREAIKAAAEVLQSEGIIGADVDIDSLSHELIQPSFAEKVVQ